MSKSPSPKLGKSTALVKSQSLNQRLDALVPTLTTALTPPNVSQPGIAASYISVYGNNGICANQAGVWTAPDVNGNGADYYIQVECFAGGGGGGGGNTAEGGGGGGGGEYACEPAYKVTPGKSYVWSVGGGGTPGFAANGSVQAGSSGALTMFDVTELSFANGVQAQGGQGGDVTGLGQGGAGGTGSTAGVNGDGGAGGLNQGGVASDNPVALLKTSSLWANWPGNIKPAAWYILDDNTSGTNKVSDASGNGIDATVTNYTGGLATQVSGAPAQAPTYTAASGSAPFYTTNPTVAGKRVQIQKGSLNKASARIATPSFGLSGQYFTVSCWVQCDPSGVFGNNTTGSDATIAANCDYPNQGKGYALFWRNTGTPAQPNWNLIFYVSNGSSTPQVIYNVGALNPASVYQVTATFANGTMTLYVNGVSAGTTAASFTSVPGGSYTTALGVNPATNGNWYFGYLSNVWFVNGGALGLTGVQQAYGLSPALGGCGGGATGSYGGAGGTGASPSGTAGGTGGTAAAVPSSVIPVATAGNSGVTGANAGNSDITASPSFGAGGGGAGNSGSTPPAAGVLVVPFTSAVTYCGTDAGAAAGQVYTPALQGTSNVLFTGGLATDVSSGSKNSLLLLPPGAFSSLNGIGGPKSATAMQLLLTVFNANPVNTSPVILEIGYSLDTVLPSSYTGNTIIHYAGFMVIPPGAGAVTIDLTQSALFTALFSSGSIPTAIVLGPGSAPSYDAYNASSGSAFYCQVFAPGAVDSGGNSLQPFFTVNSSVTTGSAPNRGSYGGGGQLNVSLVNNAATPVFTVGLDGSVMFKGSATGGTSGAFTVDPSGNTATHDIHANGFLYGNAGTHTLTIGDNTNFNGVNVSGINLLTTAGITVTGGGITTTNITMTGTLTAGAVTLTASSGNLSGVNTLTAAGITVTGGGITTTNLTVNSNEIIHGTLSVDSIQPYVSGAVGMYYNSSSYSAYWTTDGIHVTQKLWGVSGNLTVGDFIVATQGVNAGGGSGAGYWIGANQVILANATFGVGSFASGVGISAGSAHFKNSLGSGSITVDTDVSVGGNLHAPSIDASGGYVTVNNAAKFTSADGSGVALYASGDVNCSSVHSAGTIQSSGTVSGVTVSAGSGGLSSSNGINVTSGGANFQTIGCDPISGSNSIFTNGSGTLTLKKITFASGGTIIGQAADCGYPLSSSSTDVYNTVRTIRDNLRAAGMMT